MCERVKGDEKRERGRGQEVAPDGKREMQRGRDKGTWQVREEAESKVVAGVREGGEEIGFLHGQSRPVLSSLRVLGLHRVWGLQRG